MTFTRSYPFLIWLNLVCTTISPSLFSFSVIIPIIMTVCHPTLLPPLKQVKPDDFCSSLILYVTKHWVVWRTVSTSEKSWRFAFSIRKNFSRNRRNIVYRISSTNASVIASVSLSAKSNLTELVSTYFSPTPSPSSRKCRWRSLKWEKKAVLWGQISHTETDTFHA